MKSERAITLESLIIYITVTVLAIGILSKISTVFYNNIQYVDSEGIFAIEYQKFNSSFIEDIKITDITIISTRNVLSAFFSGLKLILYSPNKFPEYTLRYCKASEEYCLIVRTWTMTQTDGFYVNITG